MALASQKTLENLFGGMMVIGDSPIRIGNFCRVGTMTGTVEDIGLRSTRIRTFARTVISIPNADLASQSIENFAARDKILFNPVFALRYETTADQLRFVLAEIRALLYRHQQVETSSARVRLLRFAASGLEVEIFAYVTVTDYDEFLAIQEDLLLRLMDDRSGRHGAGLPVADDVLHAGRGNRPGEGGPGRRDGARVARAGRTAVPRHDARAESHTRRHDRVSACESVLAPPAKP